MVRDTLTFDSGAVRDSSTGKPRYDLITPFALRRWADLMARGAEKYSERNWEQGMPTSRSFESAMRHLIEWYSQKQYGTTPYDEEDHLAAVLFNVGSLIHFEDTEHDDLGPFEDE